jgi:hypothetical protein
MGVLEGAAHHRAAVALPEGGDTGETTDPVVRRAVRVAVPTRVGPGRRAVAAVDLGFGRIVALHDRSSALHQIH